MKIQIENLKAQMQGRELNIYQKAEALVEFNNLLDYVEELEQPIHIVVGQGEQSVCDICDGSGFRYSPYYDKEVVCDCKR